MAYIIDGISPKGYYIDLWYDYNDHTTVFEFYQMDTEEERDKLIEKFQNRGHELPPDWEG